MTSLAAIKPAGADPGGGERRAQAKDQGAMPAKTILVVDDSRSARFAMRRFLENFHYAVDTAASAEEALAYLQIRAPEVVFLDHLMPGTDGLMALQAIRQDARTAQLPIVLCSSNEAAEFLRQARALGALDVLPKPPTTDQLRAVLDRVERLRSQVEAATPKPPVDAPPEAPAAADPIVVAAASAAVPEQAAAPPELAAPAEPEPATPPAVTVGNIELETRLRGLAEEFTAQLTGLREQLKQYEPAGTAAAAAAQLQPAMGQGMASLAEELERRLSALQADFDQSLLRQAQHFSQLLQEQEQRFEDQSQRQARRFEIALQEQSERFEALRQEQQRQLQMLEARLQQALADQTAASAAKIAERLVHALRDGLFSAD